MQLFYKTLLLVVIAITNSFSFGTPSWVKSKPVDSCFFYGRATLFRSANIDEDRKKAKDAALAEIASEIKSVIAVETKSHLQESNGAVTSDFQETVMNWVERTELTGFDAPFPEYESGGQLWVIYRLSRSHYYNTLYAGWQNSINDGASLCQSGLKSTVLPEKIITLSKAVKIVSPYFNKSVRYMDCGKSKVLDGRAAIEGRERVVGDFASSELRTLLSNIKFTPLNPVITVASARPVDQFIEVKVENASGSISGLALKLIFNKKFWTIETRAVTDKDGIAKFKIIRSGAPGGFTVSAAPECALPDSICSLYSIVYPVVNIQLDRKSPMVFLNVQESNNNTISTVYLNKLKQYLSRETGMALTDREKADIVLEGIVVAENDGMQMGMCRARARAEIKIISRNGIERKFADQESKALERYDVKKAGEKALDIAADKHAEKLADIILESY